MSDATWVPCVGTAEILGPLYKYEIHREPIRGMTVSDPITRALQVAELARKVLGPIDREVFLVLHLDIKNRVTGMHEAARGGAASCAVDPVQVFRPAILNGATRIILVHNHPSNHPAPSAEDLSITKRLVEGATLLGLKILDHVIIADDSHFGMLDAGIVNFSPTVAP